MGSESCQKLCHGITRRVPVVPIVVVVVLLSLVTWPWVLPLLLWTSSNTNFVPPPPADSSNETAVKDSAVPKFIHQTWKDEKIPEKWQTARQSCLDQHPGYQVKLWTDASAREFIAKYFPAFLHMYDSYPYSIERADVIRYFLLYQYGGIYLDLDIECLHSLDFLRQYNFVIPQTRPVGFSNDFMMAAPQHPFLKQMLEALPYWNLRLVTKYPTVMFSTGPMFVTLQASGYSRRNELWVLPFSLYGKYVNSSAALMGHLHGSSWHSDDANAAKWVVKNLLVIGLAMAAVLTVVAATLTWQRYVNSHRLQVAQDSLPLQFKSC